MVKRGTRLPKELGGDSILGDIKSLTGGSLQQAVLIAPALTRDQTRWSPKMLNCFVILWDRQICIYTCMNTQYDYKISSENQAYKDNKFCEVCLRGS